MDLKYLSMLILRVQLSQKWSGLKEACVLFQVGMLNKRNTDLYCLELELYSWKVKIQQLSQEGVQGTDVIDLHLNSNQRLDNIEKELADPM